MIDQQLLRLLHDRSEMSFFKDLEEDKTMPTLMEEKIRVDLVARVRAEIAAGTYDTDEKFDAAIARFIFRESVDD
ncbi:MAG: hypothetical protein R3B84_04915 [Zavarzinella sp.]